jgi:hypothetical protein
MLSAGDNLQGSVRNDLVKPNFRKRQGCKIRSVGTTRMEGLGRLEMQVQRMFHGRSCTTVAGMDVMVLQGRLGWSPHNIPERSLGGLTADLER